MQLFLYIPYHLYTSYNYLLESDFKVFCNLSDVKEPESYEEAVQDLKWLEAMQQELEAFNENQTWQLVDLPSNKKDIGCKWVFKVKYNAKGEVERYKAQLVANGYTQQ